MLNLLRIELFKISRRPRTYIAFVAITAIVFIFQFAFKADGQSYINLLLQSVKDTFEFERVKAINGYFMCYIILNTLLIQVPILVALIAADSISGEANMGTLRLLMSKPISRQQLILVKFAAATIFTVLLLLWMAVTSLLFSLAIFGADDMLVFRTKGEESQIMLITKDDVVWRYLAAFAYATVALTVIAALSLFLSIFAENSIGPIIATVCLVIVCTIISNLDVPVIDRNVKPFLFTSYLVGWKGFFYIGTNAEGMPVKGSIENWASIRNSLYILLLHIFIFVSASVVFFKRRDILS
jgi:ABC-2 type transport system permease protein